MALLRGAMRLSPRKLLSLLECHRANIDEDKNPTEKAESMFAFTNLLILNADLTEDEEYIVNSIRSKIKQYHYNADSDRLEGRLLMVVETMKYDLDYIVDRLSLELDQGH